jgi:hypothetical protein
VRFSCERVTDETTLQQKLVFRGVLTLSGDYVQNINLIETDRYVIGGIDVYKEKFDSESDDIVYLFNATGIEVKR